MPTLIQISDLHLGRSFGGLDIGDDLRRELAQASMHALASACELARERHAAALLVAGDLFDRPEVEPELYEQVRAHFAALDPDVPVLVSPGNHDAFGATSVWNRRFLERVGLEPWPANVHIFESRDITAHPLPGGDIVVCGHRVEGHHGRDDSPLAQCALPGGARWRILLIHGALSLPIHDNRTTMPFTAAQLDAIGADYAAVGHYHGFTEIAHAGRTLGAYAGVPVPGAIDEDPHGGVLVITLEDGREPAVELVTTHPGRIRQLHVGGNPPFESVADAVERITRRADSTGITAADMLVAELCDLSRADLDVVAIREALRDRFRAVMVRDRTEPELAAAPRGRVTVESQFVDEMNDQIKGCGDDPQRLAALQAALHHGRVALRGRDVRPPSVPTVVPDEVGHAS